MPAKLTFSSLFLLCLATIAPTLAHADTWKEIGETGGPIFWAAGLGSSLLQDGKLGVDHAARTTDGFIAALALTEGLKATVRERRPYQDKVDSFPSGHTTLSFEIAAAQSYYHPHQAAYWYGAATLIAYSRVRANDHFWQDVVAGAGIGFLAGDTAVHSPKGWLLTPLVNSGKVGGSLVYSSTR